MLYLLLTIVLNVYLYISFKIFERLGVDSLQAIVVNYWVCVITGSVSLGRFPVTAGSTQQDWLPWAMLMGTAFISIFNLVAFCTRIDGITTTTIANKLSLVIPVLFAVWLYGDKIGWTKAAGIVIAFPAVYLSTRTAETTQKQQKLFWPLLLFAGSGLLDTLVTYAVHHFFTTGNSATDIEGQSVFLIHAFATAGTIGVITVTILFLLRRRRFGWKHVLAGILLGVPNWFSIYFLFRVLQIHWLPASAIVPVNNIGIVVGAALCAVLFFGEKAGRARLAGMFLAVAAMLAILLSDLYGHTA